MALVAGASAVKLEQQGIDYKELHEGPHWKKAWPVGAIDDSSEDAEIIDRFTYAAPPAPPAPIHQWHTYEPHTLDWSDHNADLYHTSGDKKAQ